MEGLALPFLGVVVAPALSVAIYLYARRRWDSRETHTTARAYLFYRMVSGVLLGQFLGHTEYTADLRFLNLFIMVGMVSAMDLGDTIGRSWNRNTEDAGIADYDRSDDEHADLGFNKETMEEEPYVVASAVATPEFAKNTWTVADAAKLLTKRRWLLGVLVGVFTVVVMMDGLLVVVRVSAARSAAGANNTSPSPLIAGILICYYASGSAMSIAVYSAMLHARLQATQFRRVWIALTAVWCAVLVCSAIPTLVGMSPAFALAVVTHRAFLCVYGLSSGCVLWLYGYYYNMKRRGQGKRSVWLGVLVFGAAAYQGMLTGYFL